MSADQGLTVERCRSGLSAASALAAVQGRGWYAIEQFWRDQLNHAERREKPQVTAREMTAEFDKWRDDNRITDEGDAMDLMFYEHRTPEELRWLSDFSERWTEAARENDAAFYEYPA